MMRSPRGLALGLLLCACGLSAEEQFIGKATLDECNSAVPVCSSTAGCRLGEDENYVRVKVPGYRSFVVNTKGEADLVIKTYWKKQLSPGQDIEFIFHEPGCSEPHLVTTTGQEMFRQIGQDQQWEVKQTVYQGGDHLVEMRMDSQGEFLLKAVIITPTERNAPEEYNDAPEPDLPPIPGF